MLEIQAVKMQIGFNWLQVLFSYGLFLGIMINLQAP